MFDAILSEYNALEQEISRKREAVVEAIKPKFHEPFAKFFEAHEELEALWFCAYTPYFNDGEECIFSVRETYGVVGDDEYVYGYGDEPVAKSIREADDIVHSLPEDVIRGLFGDHVKVVITRDGVNVEEYDHD
jgi:hypothetical protein